MYYTVTGQKLFMRVPVEPATLAPAGRPELVDSGRMAHDFCIDEEAEVAYVTTHRENTIDRIPLGPGGAARAVVAGEPLDALLLGPSSAAWSRLPGERGRVAYVFTDGGPTASSAAPRCCAWRSGRPREVLGWACEVQEIAA